MGQYTWKPELYTYDADMLPVREHDQEKWIAWVKDNMLVKEFHGSNSSHVKLFFLGQDPQEFDPPILFEVYYYSNQGGETQRFLTYKAAKGFFDTITAQFT